MKYIPILLASTFFSFSFAKTPNFTAKKWELYKKINQMTSELDSNEHNEEKINKVSALLDQSLQILQSEYEIKINPPTQIELHSPTNPESNDSTPTLRVSGGDLTTGFSVNLYIDSNCTIIVGSHVATGQNVYMNVELKRDGAYSFYANIINDNGTSSPCSTVSASYILDTTAPTSPSIIFIDKHHTDANSSPPIYFGHTNRQEIQFFEIGISDSAIGGDSVAKYIRVPAYANYYQFAGLMLSYNVNYYISIYAIDKAGNKSTRVISNPFTVLR